MGIFQGHLEDGDIPFLEDVLNDATIQSFNAWRGEKGNDPLSSAPPSYAVNADKRVAHAVAGRQAGVGSSKLAFAPLVDEASDKLRHLEATIELASCCTLPWDGENHLMKT